MLQLRGAGAIAGSVRVEDGIPGDKLAVRSEPVEGSERERFLEWGDGETKVQDDGTFVIPGLHPGLYHVGIYVDGTSRALLRVENVRVVDGETTRDPRLQDVDLTGRLHRFVLTVVRPDGGQDVRGNLRFDEAGAESLNSWHWFDKPEFELISTHAAIDVDLDVPGFRPARLRGLTGDATVELSEGLSVRIVLTGDAPLPDPPFYIKPALVPADGEGGASIDWGADPMDETREVVLKAVEPGRMRVTWLVERRSAQGAMATSSDVKPEQFVEVLPGVAEQRFEVSLTSEQMAEIVSTLAR